MARMKTFLIYLLVVVAVYFFVDFASSAYIKTTYEDLNNFSINMENPKVIIKESKATYINGYIKGYFLNNEEYTINNKYVKLDKFNSNEEKEFEVRYNLEKVKSYKISLVDDNENISEEELKLDPEMTGIVFVISLFFVEFM